MASVDLGMVAGKRRRKVVYAASRKEAAAKLQRVLTAKSDHSLVTGRVTMETWLTYWLDVICPERGLKVNTLKSHRSKVKRYLIPHLGHIRVDRLEPSHIRTMYAALRKEGLSETTLSQTHAVLRRALEIAVRERKANYNAAAQMDRPQARKSKQVGLSLDDARRVLAAAGDDPRFYLALLYGLRQGEVLALRWTDVALEDGVLYVERSVSRNPGGGFVYDAPKTELSRRTLPLLPVVASRLTVKRAAHLAAGGSDDALIFQHKGKPVDPKADWKAWRALLDKAGAPHITLHAARNSAASLLRELGASDRDVADILGHASIQMTRHYQADDLNRKRVALAALEAALAPDR